MLNWPILHWIFLLRAATFVVFDPLIPPASKLESITIVHNYIRFYLTNPIFISFYLLFFVDRMPCFILTSYLVFSLIKFSSAAFAP